MSNLKQKYPDIYKKFIAYKKDRKNDTHSSEERKIARDEIINRFQEYKKQKELKDEDVRAIIQEQNELIEKQAAEIERMKTIMKERIGSPLKTVNRDSPLKLVYPKDPITTFKKNGGKSKRISKTRKHRKIKKTML